MRKLSLSTMWAMRRLTRMVDLPEKARSLGFDYVELATEITPEMLAEMESTSGLSVASLHNPCPTGATGHGLSHADLLLSALYEDERRLAVDVAKGTIDLAARLVAQAVVLHMGTVKDADGFMQRLVSMFGQAALTQEYQDTRAELEALRMAMAEPYVAAAERSLSELHAHAAENGIKLGLENRYHVEEIPSLAEMERLLGRYHDGVVGYWHDVGHAEVQARLGFAPHRQWLEWFGERVVGMHVHDVNGLVDHWSPGDGTVDWGMIAGARLPEDLTVVCEVDSTRNSEESIARVPAFLQKIGLVTANR